MFDEIIAKLLTLKSSLVAAKEQKIIEAVQNIEQEFEENAIKIQKALDDFGYVAPVEENQVTALDYNA